MSHIPIIARLQDGSNMHMDIDPLQISNYGSLILVSSWTNSQEYAVYTAVHQSISTQTLNAIAKIDVEWENVYAEIS